MSTYYAYIKGLNFRGDEVKAYVNELEFPARIALDREPENPHDPNAIRAYHEDVHLGYIAKEIAEFIAPRIDAGDAYTATVTGIETKPRAVWLVVELDFTPTAS